MNRRKKILVVVDMQNDFISGVLGTPEAQAIVPKVVDKIKEYKKNGNIIIATQDTHYSNYLETHEGKKLPIKHCIINTDGWQLNKEVYDTLRGYNNYYNISKVTFGTGLIGILLEEIFELDKAEKGEELEIEFTGLVADICVISNIICSQLRFPEAELIVDQKCTAGTTPYLKECAMIVCKSLQVNVI